MGNELSGIMKRSEHLPQRVFLWAGPGGLVMKTCPRQYTRTKPDELNVKHLFNDLVQPAGMIPHHRRRTDSEETRKVAPFTTHTGPSQQS